MHCIIGTEDPLCEAATTTSQLESNRIEPGDSSISGMLPRHPIAQFGPQAQKPTMIVHPILRSNAKIDMVNRCTQTRNANKSQEVLICFLYLLLFVSMYLILFDF